MTLQDQTVVSDQEPKVAHPPAQPTANVLFKLDEVIARRLPRPLDVGLLKHRHPTVFLTPLSPGLVSRVRSDWERLASSVAGEQILQFHRFHWLNQMNVDP